MKKRRDRKRESKDGGEEENRGERRGCELKPGGPIRIRPITRLNDDGGGDDEGKGGERVTRKEIRTEKRKQSGRCLGEEKKKKRREEVVN